ncbi:hypothetical protein K437DRAFT_220029 [Tilletiaria anomala UBC 951]|uniref:RBR-type E3 ubiquitin transferase n=1 Tax=Tilletiaria anomala (strain ATCC 24038 / CBS 436.72 / UBC 951) TaxID=1037660 RepID=A0A066WQ86_TILAU|nr:uncharacterized protein K437DRAFT_220029 [Tilletiaria anomala UBC 951]KDN52785.1 hypothetical protein K437DRAFT_220029 [Tilletiaria anomala UBC 951]
MQQGQGWTDSQAQEWRDAIVLPVEGSIDEQSASSSTLSALLTHFSKHRILTLFSHTRFNCSICLESVKGRLCTRLEGCGHVFCTPCLQDYLCMLVKEGDWRGARRCPDLECTAMPSGLISRTEIQSLVGEELLARYDWLELKAVAETDPNATHCPISACGGIARGDAREAGTWSEGLRICSSCGYAFCCFCEKAWHGKAPCTLVQISALIEEYASLIEGSAEQKAFEARYGRSNILRLTRIYNEEIANRNWIRENSTACPSCSVNIVKSEGCNHMTCRACQAHFCYLCQSTLSAANPYVHYNTPGIPCYQKLFHGLEHMEDGEEFEPLPWEGFPHVEAI